MLALYVSVNMQHSCVWKKKQVRIHESTVACDWAGAVMPENYEKKCAEDAAVEYHLLVKGSTRARARFGIQPGEDLAYESFVVEMDDAEIDDAVAYGT